LGSDSHTPAGGALGMLAIGAGGLEVALAMAGEPLYIKMPKIWGVKLTGKLPGWVSAKDVILEMLRRHDVDGGINKIVEYYGPGLQNLTAMDRHVIANMGTELGATTTVFPSDEEIKRFLRTQQREKDWKQLTADEGAEYDEYEELNLSDLEPLIALPGSPGKVVPVREVAGSEIYQTYIGSSANPGLRDFAIAALMVDGKQINDKVSFDINPTSRQILENLISSGLLGKLIHAGARLHQAGCNGCIGMGQAPATDKISLRTVPRNFPGRSGTREDKVYLCSPETAAASALTGVITDPRTLGMDYPQYKEPEKITINIEMLVPPAAGKDIEIEKGPNIKPLPPFTPIPDNFEGTVLLKAGNNISTDEIMPAGAKVLPYRSNIPEISKFVFSRIDESFYDRALEYKEEGFFVIGGENYGQGSSREHAALAPRYLGLRVVIAVSFARIHWQNLINFGILPLTFADPSDLNKIEQGDILSLANLIDTIKKGYKIVVKDKTKNLNIPANHAMSKRQVEMIIHGSLIELVKNKFKKEVGD
ncbi:MAG TPA: aconitate hydratase, partial [Ignavibacteriaceae bacterium]|nr:aconitate hydratase [Ignavibacteriaceae bacterium]